MTIFDMLVSMNVTLIFLPGLEYDKTVWAPVIKNHVKNTTKNTTDKLPHFFPFTYTAPNTTLLLSKWSYNNHN